MEHGANQANSPIMRLRMGLADLRGRGVYAGYPNRYRCIFIHIPKTAGTAIASTLFDEPSRHVPYFEYLQANPVKFRRYFKFAFVRNPWDRLVSSYFYLRDGGSGGEDKTWSERNLGRYPDFRGFVREWLTLENVQTWRHFLPQVDFIIDPKGTMMMDFVGRYERLAEDYRFVADRLGCTASLQILNKSAHRHFSTYYDAETSAIVRRVYARDIEIFGYTIGSPVEAASDLRGAQLTFHHRGDLASTVEALEWRDDVAPGDWDAALAALGGHPLQSALWGDACRGGVGIADRRLMAMRGKEVLWMLRYEERKVGPLGRIAWAPRGPTTSLPLAKAQEVLSAVRSKIKSHGMTLLVADRWARADEPAARQSAGRPMTFWIDLTQGRDAAWRRLDKQWRYGVGKARRSGITVVRTCSDADLKAFFALCAEISQSKNFRLPGNLPLMRALLAPDRQGAVEALIFLARAQGHIAAGAFVLRCGRSVHYMWGATDRRFAQQRGGEAVHWSIIEWAIGQGCTLYDLEGFDRYRNPGTFAFKKKMGGEPVTLIGKEYYPIDAKGVFLKWSVASARLFSRQLRHHQ